MKILLISLAAVAIAVAQQPPAPPSAPGVTQEGNKMMVPLSNPSQPATIKISMISGSVNLIGGGDAKQVIVESSGLSRRHRRDTAVPPGMHRIDTGNSAEIVEDHNVVTIKPGIGGSDEHMEIQAPANANVVIKSVACGGISVAGVTGDIEVECTNGSLDLKNISGSVVAHTVNGSINVVMDKVSPDKAMSFTSLNGKIDVTLPGDTKARLRIKTNNGSVFTDFDVKMEADASKPLVENGGRDGKYRIKMDRGVYGSINGGGPEYTFQTMNGEILIHKK